VDAAALTAPLDRAERRAVSAFLAAGLVSAATANAARAELEHAEHHHHTDHVSHQASHHAARRAV
jgi:hypothetical protein